MDSSQWYELMIIYGFGYFAIVTVFLLLHIHAYKKGNEIDLNKIEVAATIGSIRSYSINIFIALCSLLIVIIGGAKYAAISGWIYVLIGPASAVN